MKTPQKGFLSKLNPSNWGFPPRTTTSQVIEEQTSQLGKRTGTVTTASVIAVSPSSDSHVKIEGSDESFRDPIVTSGCRISNEGDVLTIVYDCDEETDESSETETHKKAQQFFSCLNLDQRENDSCSQKSSTGEISESSQTKISQGSHEISETSTRDEQDHEIDEVVNQGATSKTLSCVELNQAEKVFIEKSASAEDIKQKVTSSEHSSSKDVDGTQKDSVEKGSSHRSSLAKELNQKVSSEKMEQQKFSVQEATTTTNETDKVEKRKLATKQSCEGPSRKLTKHFRKLSENSVIQADHKTLDRDSKGEHGDTTTCSILPSLADLTSGKTQTELSPFTATDLVESGDYEETLESNVLEIRDSPKPFPNKMTMRSYQNMSGKSVWELSFRFK